MNCRTGAEKCTHEFSPDPREPAGQCDAGRRTAEPGGRSTNLTAGPSSRSSSHSWNRLKMPGSDPDSFSQRRGVATARRRPRAVPDPASRHVHNDLRHWSMDGMTAKRRGGLTLQSLDLLPDSGWEPFATDDSEVLSFDREWGRAALAAAWYRSKETATPQKKRDRFAVIQRCFPVIKPRHPIKPLLRCQIFPSLFLER